MTGESKYVGAKYDVFLRLMHLYSGRDQCPGTDSVDMSVGISAFRTCFNIHCTNRDSSDQTHPRGSVAVQVIAPWLPKPQGESASDDCSKYNSLTADCTGIDDASVQ